MYYKIIWKKIDVLKTFLKECDEEVVGSKEQSGTWDNYDCFLIVK